MSEMDSLFQSFGTLLETVLPKSPFKDFYTSFVVPDFVGWLNWFFPLNRILPIFAAWLLAYGVYLAYSIILRWIKAIK